MEAVLLNLASNAGRAMRNGGTLSLSTRNLESSSPSAAKMTPAFVRLRVSDTGVGMSAETRARAWDIAFTTQNKQAGHGHGLSMVRAIVERAGGRVWLESQPGQGTTITVDLPRVTGRVATSELPPVAVFPQLGLLAVLAEGDAFAAETATEYLAQMGCTVILVDSGERALELVQQRAGAQVPQLLVTDLILDGISGWDLAQAARAANPGLDVVFTSGHGREELLERGILVDSSAVLRKPFTGEALFDAIKIARQRAQTTRPPRIR